MVEELINKKLAEFSVRFDELKSELNAKFDGLKEQVMSTAGLEETENRGRKVLGKKWPLNARVSHAILRMACHIVLMYDPIHRSMYARLFGISLDATRGHQLPRIFLVLCKMVNCHQLGRMEWSSGFHSGRRHLWIL